MRWNCVRVGLSFGIGVIFLAGTMSTALAGGLVDDDGAAGAAAATGSTEPVPPADTRVVVRTVSPAERSADGRGVGTPGVRTGSARRYASSVPVVNSGRVLRETVVEEPSAMAAPGGRGVARGVGGVSSVRIGSAPTNTAAPVYGPRVSSVDQVSVRRGGSFWAFDTNTIGGDGALIPLSEGDVDVLLAGLTPAEASFRRSQLRFSAAGTGQMADSPADDSFRRAQINFYNAGVSADRRIGAGGQRGVHGSGGVRHPAFSRPGQPGSNGRGGDAPRPAFWSGTTPIYR